ncbi:hypothetical protein V7152_26245 [Neobacillus drentensis]|uniref:hypothetical protein n=1 Tax=Neobacillus drentensis TaxID=220684 RepID=UPI0030001322
MLKSGDYELFNNGDNTINLVSNGPQSIKEGCIKDNFSNMFVKTINLKDLKNAFSVKIYGNYKNAGVNVHKENENIYLIGTTASSKAQTVGLDRTDKYYYEKWVPKENVKGFEVRKPIT